jgi:hypothetical protein
MMMRRIAKPNNFFFMENIFMPIKVNTIFELAKYNVMFFCRKGKREMKNEE